MEFIKDGKYRNKATNGGNPQFYRFDKPEDDNYPKMIELFCRSEFELKNANGITPIHIEYFIELLKKEPFDQNSLKRYMLKNNDIVDLLEKIYE